MIDRPDFVLVAFGDSIVVTPQTKRGLKFMHQQGVAISEGCAMQLCPDGAEIFAETVEDAGLRYIIIRLPRQMTRH